jgi:hypothetical protein
MNFNWAESPKGVASEVERGERRRLSARFLLQVVVPKVVDLQPDETLSSQQLDQLLIEFKENNQGLGSDFDMGIVQAHTLYIRFFSKQDMNDIWPGNPDPNKLLEVMERTVEIIDKYQPTAE